MGDENAGAYLPAYAFVDYKVQRRSLTHIIVDLVDSSIQSTYVMLSRATKLSGVAIIQWFLPKMIYRRLCGDFREEFDRLERLDEMTCVQFERRHETICH